MFCKSAHARLRDAAAPQLGILGGQIVSCVVERRVYANRHALLRFDQVACAEKAAAEMNGSKLRGSRLTVEVVGGAPGGGAAAARRPGAPY